MRGNYHRFSLLFFSFLSFKCDLGISVRLIIETFENRKTRVTAIVEVFWRKERHAKSKENRKQHKVLGPNKNRKRGSLLAQNLSSLSVVLSSIRLFVVFIFAYFFRFFLFLFSVFIYFLRFDLIDDRRRRSGNGLCDKRRALVIWHEFASNKFSVRCARAFFVTSFLCYYLCNNCLWRSQKIEMFKFH